MKKLVSLARKKSPWVMHVPCGGCNGCDIEVIAALTPLYDVERFGVLLKGTPRHADVLLVTGPVTVQIRDRLKRIYELTPDPKLVMAVGSCACTGCIFEGSYAVAGPLNKTIPVDVYVPGCPPKPEALIDGVVKALQRLD